MEANTAVTTTVEFISQPAPVRQVVELPASFWYAWGELARRLDAYGVWLAQREAEPAVH